MAIIRRMPQPNVRAGRDIYVVQMYPNLSRIPGESHVRAQGHGHVIGRKVHVIKYVEQPRVRAFRGTGGRWEWEESDGRRGREGGRKGGREEEREGKASRREGAVCEVTVAVRYVI